MDSEREEVREPDAREYGLRPLRVLIIEDSEDDTLLLVRRLRRSGFSPDYARVETPGALERALDEREWELIITDYNMPQFSPDDVLDAVTERGLDLPIILVSAQVADARAAEAMKRGVHDYVLKDNLSRLGPAIERELREAHNRRAHRRATAKLAHVARHDPLTGLGNRRTMEERLASALASVDGRGHAFIYLDIDRFHVVNDTGGHPAGDALIEGLAPLLSRHLRDTDTLARIGPDEFGVLLQRSPLSRAWRIADQMRSDAHEYRLAIGGQTYRVTASVGLVPIEHRDLSVAEILRRSDLACRAAKDLGRNRIHVYSENDQDLLRRHGDMAWVGRLREALDSEAFVLHGQPIRALDVGASERCCELLCRLVEADGTLVKPGEFVAAAEHFDLMPQIDHWVIRNALALIAARASRYERWFINLSARSLSDEALPEFVAGELDRHGVAGERICFEITETAAMTHVDIALRFMRNMRELGCSVALDDFGSGLSSFNYLKSLPADYLKIDGSFIRGMLDNALDYTIVESVTRIGHAAGMKVIAEWVESETAVETLMSLGVDYAQGYAIARPGEV